MTAPINRDSLEAAKDVLKEAEKTLNAKESAHKKALHKYNSIAPKESAFSVNRLDAITILTNTSDELKQAAKSLANIARRVIDLAVEATEMQSLEEASKLEMEALKKMAEQNSLKQSINITFNELVIREGKHRNGNQ